MILLGWLGSKTSTQTKLYSFILFFQLYETATGRKLPDVRKSRYGGFPIMVLRFHPKNPSIIYAGTSEGQVLSCDVSEFVNDGPHDKHALESCKDERWTEIIRGIWLAHEALITTTAGNILIFFFFFSEKIRLGFHINCLIWNAKSYFLSKIVIKQILECCLLLFCLALKGLKWNKTKTKKNAFLWIPFSVDGIHSSR